MTDRIIDSQQFVQIFLQWPVGPPHFSRFNDVSLSLLPMAFVLLLVRWLILRYFCKRLQVSASFRHLGSQLECQCRGFMDSQLGQSWYRQSAFFCGKFNGRIDLVQRRFSYSSSVQYFTDGLLILSILVEWWTEKCSNIQTSRFQWSRK